MSLSLLVLVPSFASVLDSRDLRGAMVGAVVAAPDGRALWSRNPDVRLMPASNQKMFSVAYALDTLGGSYRSVTRFWHQPDGLLIRSDGTLDMSYAALREIAGTLGHKRGTIRFWQAYRPGRPDSWQLGDGPNRYAPTIAALSCERGGVTVSANADGTLRFSPAPMGIEVVQEPSPAVREARPIAKGLSYDPESGTLFRPEGTELAPGEVDTLSQPAPDLAAARLFGDEVVEEYGAAPGRAADLTVNTDRIGTVAGRCLAPSDNFLAEHLLMMATTRKLGKPADWTNAPNALRAWAKSRVGLPDGTFDPADGSGLSRKNLVTARSVARLVNWSRGQTWAKPYWDGMARPGTGTLKSRLKGVGFRGKTGTLTGVSALSGLVRCKSGRELAVSLIMNHYPCSAARARQLQDEWVRRVAASY